MRHPQEANCSVLVENETSRKTRLEVTSPTGTPSWTKLPYQPRRPDGACSVAISTAPPHSPPTARPCSSRSVTSRTGAATPIWA